MGHSGGAVVSVQHALGRAEGAAQDRDGVRRDRGLTEEAIEEYPDGGSEGIGASHHFAAATSNPTVSPMTPAAPSTSPV